MHTNLGRAPLPQAALERLGGALAAGYFNLELDLDSGERGGSRYTNVAQLFNLLSSEPGGQDLDTVIVNNNAAAVLVTLKALAAGSEVIVSRGGQLVEIGGAVFESRKLLLPAAAGSKKWAPPTAPASVITAGPLQSKQSIFACSSEQLQHRGVYRNGTQRKTSPPGARARAAFDRRYRLRRLCALLRTAGHHSSQRQPPRYL